MERNTCNKYNSRRFQELYNLHFQGKKNHRIPTHSNNKIKSQKYRKIQTLDTVHTDIARVDKMRQQSSSKRTFYFFRSITGFYFSVSRFRFWPAIGLGYTICARRVDLRTFFSHFEPHELFWGSPGF